MRGLLIAAGGTGGHVFPAMAVGQAWQRLYPEAPLWWAGRSKGQEANWIAPLQVAYEGVPSAGWQRTRPWRNAALLYKLPWGWYRLQRVFRRWPVGAVFTTGGYPGLLPGWMAAQKGLPLALLELNVAAGRTIRWLSARARVIFSAFPQLKGLPSHANVVWSGVPVRFSESQRTACTPSAARAQLGFDPERPLILVLGGSQGSATLNRMVAAALPYWQKLSVSLLWQVGAGVEAIIPPDLAVQTKPFIQDMALAYQAATLVIARAGGSTLGEIAWWGKAAILVPSPYVAEDHQRGNARYWAEQGAAMLVEETAEPEILSKAVQELLQEVEKRSAMEAAARALAKPQAAETIAQTLYHLAYGS